MRKAFLLVLFFAILLFASCDKDNLLKKDTEATELTSDNEVITVKSSQEDSTKLKYYNDMIKEKFYNVSSNYKFKDFYYERNTSDTFNDYIDLNSYYEQYFYMDSKKYFTGNFKSGEYEYSLYENQYAMINTYSGIDETLVVPSQIDGYTVIAIGNNGYDFITNKKTKYKLRSISFPNTLKYIGNSTFSDCNSLESVDLPDSLIVLGRGAFSSCKNLKSIHFNENLLEIGINAFYHCANLSNVSFGGNEQLISSFAFAECYKLRSLLLPDSLKIIEQYAFFRSENLSQINVPASLQVLGFSALDGTKAEDIKQFEAKGVKVIVDETNTDYNRLAYKHFLE